MRVIELTENFLNINEILDSAAIENIILKVSDGREFVLAEVDSFDRDWTDKTKWGTDEFSGSAFKRWKNVYAWRS